MDINLDDLSVVSRVLLFCFCIRQTIELQDTGNSRYVAKAVLNNCVSIQLVFTFVG